MKIRSNFKIFVLIFGIIILSSIAVVKLNDKAVATNKKETNAETIVYLGKEKAKNEILFVFDYSCPYCHQWISEKFPDIYDKFIKTGIAKFRSQSMVYLNENSFKLSKIDQNIKVFYPEKYFEFFLKVMNGDHKINIDQLINDSLKKYGFQKDKILKEPKMDVINLTRKYTRKYEIDSVPTVIVNGKKLNDPFNVDEIRSNLSN